MHTAGFGLWELGRPPTGTGRGGDYLRAESQAPGTFRHFAPILNYIPV